MVAPNACGPRAAAQTQYSTVANDTACNAPDASISQPTARRGWRRASPAPVVPKAPPETVCISHMAAEETTRAEALTLVPLPLRLLLRHVWGPAFRCRAVRLYGVRTVGEESAGALANT